MKIYSTFGYPAVADFLFRNGHPYRFDGQRIYFTCTEDYIETMKESSEYISHVNFREEEE